MAVTIPKMPISSCFLFGFSFLFFVDLIANILKISAESKLLQYFGQIIVSMCALAFSQGARGTPDGTHNPQNVTHEKRLSPRAEALLTRGRATNPPPTLKIISFFFHDERRSKLSIQTYANGALCSARTFPI